MKLTEPGLPDQLAREILPPGTDPKTINKLTQQMAWAWKKGKIPTSTVWLKKPRYNRFSGLHTEVTEQHHQIALGDAAEWARNNGFPVRDEILELLPPVDNPSPPGSGDEGLGTRQKNTYLRIIGALLKDGYRMDIHAGKLSGISELLADLERQGADISEKTLRTIIKEAAELLPPIETRKP